MRKTGARAPHDPQWRPTSRQGFRTNVTGDFECRRGIHIKQRFRGRHGIMTGMLGQLASIEVAGRLGLALAMAVFLGLAFEGVYKIDERGNPGGIRTFPLLATLGALLFLLQPSSLLPFVIGLGAVAAWQYAHVRVALIDPGQRPSLMIPTASALAYTLGPIALTQPS